MDFVYVRDETARRLFEGVRTVPGPGGRAIGVPRPEHLIAMKDIGYLAKLEGVDRAEIQGYFERNGLTERWRELERSL